MPPEMNWPWNGRMEDLGALAKLAPIFGAVLLLWFLNMAVTGWLARRRGRDDGLWAVLAFFLGPIALVAVILLPRRSPPDPFEGLPETPTTYTGEWPVLDVAPPSITPAQRLLGALLGAGVGAAGAGVLAGSGAIQSIEVYIAVGAASGGILGYVLSSFLIEADRTRVIGVGVGAGVLVLSVAGLLIGVASALRSIAAGETGILALPLVLVTAPLYPIIVALFSQWVLAVSITGAAIWAAATHLLLRRLAGHPGQLARPSVG
jgi:hypothetical protein